ncbi:hypothetical protein LTS17_007466 [Exophiala oligosperma]
MDMATNGASNAPHTLYVALQSTGIVEISFDPSKEPEKSISIVGVSTDAGYMPGWVVVSRDKVYSISRTSSPGSEDESGGVFAFQIPDGASGDRGLTRIDSKSSNGKGGVHCEVSPDGKTFAAANITASTVSIFQLSEDGSMGQPTHIFDYNKSDPGPKEAHPHQATFDPTGRFLFVPLRTMDRVDIYSVRSAQQVQKVHSIDLPVPAGPRHLAFNSISPLKAYMYLVSEKDNTIRVYSVTYDDTSASGITMDLKQTLSTIEKDMAPTPDEHKDLASEVAVSKDGKFVYVSNRNLTRVDPDTMVIYSINSDQANNDETHLTFVKAQEVPGKHPRKFALSNDKDNKWVAVSNQFTQDIVIIERDLTTGLLGDVKGRVNLKVEEPHQPCPDKVVFSDVPSKMTREDFLKNRANGPMCVVWK